MSILIGLAHEPVFNAAVATQIVFQQPARLSRVRFKEHCNARTQSLADTAWQAGAER